MFYSSVYIPLRAIHCIYSRLVAVLYIFVDFNETDNIWLGNICVWIGKHFGIESVSVVCYRIIDLFFLFAIFMKWLRCVVVFNLINKIP